MPSTHSYVTYLGSANPLAPCRKSLAFLDPPESTFLSDLEPKHILCAHRAHSLIPINIYIPDPLTLNSSSTTILQNARLQIPPILRSLPRQYNRRSVPRTVPEVFHRHVWFGSVLDRRQCRTHVWRTIPRVPCSGSVPREGKCKLLEE